MNQINQIRQKYQRLFGKYRISRNTHGQKIFNQDVLSLQGEVAKYMSVYASLFLKEYEKYMPLNTRKIVEDVINNPKSHLCLTDEGHLATGGRGKITFNLNYYEHLQDMYIQMNLLHQTYETKASEYVKNNINFKNGDYENCAMFPSEQIQMLLTSNLNAVECVKAVSLHELNHMFLNNLDLIKFSEEEEKEFKTANRQRQLEMLDEKRTDFQEPFAELLVRRMVKKYPKELDCFFPGKHQEYVNSAISLENAVGENLYYFIFNGDIDFLRKIYPKEFSDTIKENVLLTREFEAKQIEARRIGNNKEVYRLDLNFKLKEYPKIKDFKTELYIQQKIYDYVNSLNLKKKTKENQVIHKEIKKEANDLNIIK